jgi:hypothetical protein
MHTSAIVNPFFSFRRHRRDAPTRSQPREVQRWAKLPMAPVNASPVPHLTSLYHHSQAGEYGRRDYPGNCGGNLIKDLLNYFSPSTVLDPMTGGGTCRDVCAELGLHCWSSDLHQDVDACSPSAFPRESFQFCWLHPPYTQDARDLSRTETLDAFLVRYRQLIVNCAGALVPGGRLAILMGDYFDRDGGFVPLVYHTKRLAFEAGLRQCCTDIIRFSHGASSSRRVYRSSFIPGLHDVCMIFEKEKRQ